MTFQQKLDAIVKKNNSLVCIGLDSDIDKLPEHLKNEPFTQFAFNKAIIDATHDLVCAYKPNSAFYEAFGSEGIRALKMTCDYLREKYSDIAVILDAKRGDMGETAINYAKYVFDYLRVDAVTLHCYLGQEAQKAFLARIDKGLIILCRTSNPGAGEFQDLKIIEKDKNTSGVAGWSGSGSHDSPDGGGINKPLYQIVAEHVVKYWNSNHNCGLVVGATYPSELEIVRRIAPDLPLLIPGIGAQGGDVEKTVKVGLNSKKAGMIINSSRSIIFESEGKDFAERAKEETIKLRDQINKSRFDTIKLLYG